MCVGKTWPATVKIERSTATGWRCDREMERNGDWFICNLKQVIRFDCRFNPLTLVTVTGIIVCVAMRLNCFSIYWMNEHCDPSFPPSAAHLLSSEYRRDFQIVLMANAHTHKSVRRPARAHQLLAIALELPILLTTMYLCLCLAMQIIWLCMRMANPLGKDEFRLII